MAGDDEIVVTIEADETTGTGSTDVVLVDETGITAGTTVRKGSDDPVESLKTQLAERQAALDTEKQRSANAETAASQATQRARQAEREAEQARTEVAASQRTTVDSGIAAAKAEADAAEESYKSAFEAGDAGAIAKANRRVAQATADLALLNQAKDDLGEVQQRQPERRTEAPQNNDPEEAFINSRTAPTQRWLREHRDYLRDPKKNAKMQAAHYDAESEGIALDSPQYFDHIERFLGMKKAAEPENKGNGADTTTSQRRPTAPVAPGNSTGGGMSGESNTVRLTKGEALAATDGTHVWNVPDPTGKNRWQVGTPIGIQEMAKRKLALTREGRYQNGNVDGT